MKPTLPKTLRSPWNPSTIALLGTMSDAALARKLGIDPKTVYKKRRKLGIAPSRPPSIRWTREMIQSLGRMPDGEVAKTYGINILTVFKKRAELGIRCYARKSKTWHYWTQKEIALLGKFTDAEVAEKTGILKASVTWKRNKLRIPPCTTRRPKRLLSEWSLAEIAVLGRMTDAEAAATLNLAPSAVRKKRIALKIPPFGRKG